MSDIMELAISGAVEGRPKVRYKDLRTLQKADFLTLETGFIPKAFEMLCQQVDQFAC